MVNIYIFIFNLGTIIRLLIEQAHGWLFIFLDELFRTRVCKQKFSSQEAFLKVSLVWDNSYKCHFVSFFKVMNYKLYCFFFKTKCSEQFAELEKIKRPLYEKHPMTKFAWTVTEDTDTVSIISVWISKLGYRIECVCIKCTNIATLIFNFLSPMEDTIENGN